jgi:GAF domain-containing protein
MQHDTVMQPVDPMLYGPEAVLATLGPDGREIVLDATRQALYGQTGSSFFDGISHFLCAVAGAELVVVGRISPDAEDTIETIARYRCGERTPNIRYTLQGTPCGTVVGPQSLCVYPLGVAERFPEDTGLAQMGAQGYVGLPLFSRDGRKIGLMALITTRPIEDVATLASLLMMVGNRASLELEYETALERSDTKAEQIAALLSAEDAKLRRAVE